MQPPLPHSMLPYQPPPAQVVARTSTAPSLPPPAPAKTSESSHPPLKCPMAGTFYRSPGPGEPPFVMADQSGTMTEILAEDGKPVSIDRPLLVIAP
ncbi:biotin carboxyl carrier protein of acetyl-CoA carboxylase 2, chloroplastic-like isoform X2 [Vitis riparia]|uniref:biotin carboxyl carrier protein of acetyl-CoA carboxylase 2, chloroplastic-like isoform X2 n=1 Tax=Vitis riparia TaxID=96939 RepID=UPI00155AD2DF|nr:biotin carboxyl carrier protein of acetyl-CoA carboxylase 2, chloroplastic-like isoform X2 [Vitis riparia]